MPLSQAAGTIHFDTVLGATFTSDTGGRLRLFQVPPEGITTTADCYVVPPWQGDRASRMDVPVASH